MGDLSSEIMMDIFDCISTIYHAEFSNGERRHPHLIQEMCVNKHWHRIIVHQASLWDTIVAYQVALLRDSDLWARPGRRPVTIAIPEYCSGTTEAITIMQQMMEHDRLRRTTCFLLHYPLLVGEHPIGDSDLHRAHLRDSVMRLVAERNNAPNLRELDLCLLMDYDNCDVRTGNIQRLRLRQACRPPNLMGWARHLQTLSLLSVSELDTTSFFIALGHMRELTNLEIRYTPLSVEGQGGPLQKHSLRTPSLKNIELHLEFEDMIDFCHIFDMPSLERAELVVYRHTAGPMAERTFKVQPKGGPPDIEAILGVLTSVARRGRCNNVVLDGTFKLRKFHIPQDSQEPFRRETMAEFHPSQNVSPWSAQQVAMRMIHDASSMRHVTHVLLDRRDRSVAGSIQQWRRSLFGLTNAVDLYIIGSSEHAQLILSAMLRVEGEQMVLPSLTRLALFPTDLNVKLVDVIFRLLCQRISSGQSADMPRLTRFVITRNKGSLASSHAEAFRQLISLPFPIVFG
ncbi:unnamed protein product [Peniophora sp. CBMAI 1063]|nr:unnamed protein product [Peniophora sp. CBMAI 1063]